MLLDVVNIWDSLTHSLVHARTHERARSRARAHTQIHTGNLYLPVTHAITQLFLK